MNTVVTNYSLVPKWRWGWTRVNVLQRIPHTATPPGVKVRDVIKLIQDDGWYLVCTRGSHRHFKHLHKLGLVSVAGHPSVDVPRGTFNSILKQVGLKE